MARMTFRLPDSWDDGIDEIALDRSEPGDRVKKSVIYREAIREKLDREGVDYDHDADLEEGGDPHADEQPAD